MPLFLFLPSSLFRPLSTPLPLLQGFPLAPPPGSTFFCPLSLAHARHHSSACSPSPQSDRNAGSSMRCLQTAPALRKVRPEFQPLSLSLSLSFSPPQRSRHKAGVSLSLSLSLSLCHTPSLSHTLILTLTRSSFSLSLSLSLCLSLSWVKSNRTDLTPSPPSPSECVRRGPALSCPPPDQVETP